MYSVERFKHSYDITDYLKPQWATAVTSTRYIKVNDWFVFNVGKDNFQIEYNFSKYRWELKINNKEDWLAFKLVFERLE